MVFTLVTTIPRDPELLIPANGIHMRYYDYLDKKFHWVTLLLLPLSCLFFLLSASRRLCYKVGVCKSVKIAVPVIVVGNITAGGAGKSPLVMGLALQLLAKGYKPGIVSRGYGGGKKMGPVVVESTSDPFLVGDEPLMLARFTQCPVVVCADRVKGAMLLVDSLQCNLIIADDGLQHYQLARDIEIIVVDSQRRFGNGFLLPAGPLRESQSKLLSANFVVLNGETEKIIDPRQITMYLEPCSLRMLVSKTESKTSTLSSFRGRRVHAVAGIANPDRFFSMLRAEGLEIIEHAFADHQQYKAQHFTFNDDLPIIMTEKDAVKCEKLSLENAWSVELRIVFPKKFVPEIVTMLEVIPKQ